MGTLPFMLYRTGADGSRSLATDDPLYGLIHEAPSADYTAAEFWEGQRGAVPVRQRLRPEGDARRPARRPDPAQQRPHGGRWKTDCGTAGSTTTRTAAAVRVYGEDEIFHVRGFGGAADDGLSPITFARQSIGSALAADEYAGTMLANGVRPDGIVSTRSRS